MIKNAYVSPSYPLETTSMYEAVEVVGDDARRVWPDVCVEGSVNLLVNGSRLATIILSPDDLEAFALGHLKCEGFIRSLKEVSSVEVKWPDIHVSVPGIEGDDLGLWVEARSSGCVGMRSSWVDVEGPLPDGLSVSKDTIFYSIGFVNDLAKTWRRTGGTHCTIIFDEVGGIVAYAEDIGRHTSVDKAVGKALIGGRDLSKCFMACTGRMAAGMVAKAYRAGIPILVSNTAPFSAGIELALRAGITLVCFARPPHMLIYSRPERIAGMPEY